MPGDAAFDDLQTQLRRLWPAVTARSVGNVERTVVVVHSLSLEMPARLAPLLNAYEERFLCLVLSLLRSPRSRVVYATSQPILPRLVDYWFELVPELDTPETRERLTLVSVVDPRPVPLTRKLLDHPGVLARIAAAIPDRSLALIMPFMVSELEVELATRLRIPLYGAHPSLSYWGTKSGSRRAFREAAVPLPAGVEDLTSVRDAVQAVTAIQHERPGVREVMVKLNNGVTGLGNGIVTLDGAGTIEDRLMQIRLEDKAATPEAFFAGLAEQGGIVEERIVGAEFRSPSVQLRVGPDGELDVLSTHDQVLGGENGGIFMGARFPASAEYAAVIGHEARKVAGRLAADGVIGRFAIDFAAVRGLTGWDVYALEINLRSGGTTHPMMTLQTLTDGFYDDERGIFLVPDGRPKHYVATDHLEGRGYERLTPDDFFDLLPSYGLGWNPDRQTGVVFHLVSAIAVAGLVGLTAIGDTPEEAAALYARAQAALDDASSQIGDGQAAGASEGRVYSTPIPAHAERGL
jgi:hypothetical protein